MPTDGFLAVGVSELAGWLVAQSRGVVSPTRGASPLRLDPRVLAVPEGCTSDSGAVESLPTWWTEAGSADPFDELSNVVLSPYGGGAFSLGEGRDLRLDHVDAVLTELSVSG